MKKRAPTDATLRNVRAANKKLTAHEQRLKRVEKAIRDVFVCGALLANHERRLLKLEGKG